MARKEFKTRYKLKLNLEKTYIEKKKKPFKRDRKLFSFLSYYKKMYNNAISHKMKILNNQYFLEIRNLKGRAKAIYESDDFKEILRIANLVKKQEKRAMFCFALMFLIFSLVTIVLYFLFNHIYMLLGAIPFVFIIALLFYPSVTYDKFYENILIDICVFATGLANKRNGFKYSSSSKDIKKMKRGKWFTDKTLRSNTFNIKTNDFMALVEKIIVRDTVDHFSVEGGKIKISKKKATIFSGYSFEFVKSNSVKTGGELCLAFLNKSTVVKSSGLTEDEEKLTYKYDLKNSLLNDNWELYIRNGISVDKKLIKYIQKQIIALENNLDNFNIYFFDDCIRVLLSVRSNRDGLLTEYFTSSLSNTKQLSFLGFYSNIKALYVFSCIEKIAQYMSRYRPINKNTWKPSLSDKSK